MVAMLLAIAPARALAFADPQQFFARTDTPHAAVTSASGEGIYFTGAPRFSHLGCTSCHTDGPGRAGVKLGADDPALFTDGYVPGRVYQIEVELLHETLGPLGGPPTCTEPPSHGDTYTYVPCNNNSFALETDRDDGPTGKLCAAPPSGGGCPAPNLNTDETVVAPGGDAVFGNRTHDPTNLKVVSRNDATRWHFWWTAPPAGNGRVTFYVGVVDGDGGGSAGAAENDQDPLGDDALEAAIPVFEAGAPRPPVAGAGCSSARGAFAPALLVVLGVGLFAWAVRRRFS
jgi:hypothetical protein